MTEPGPPSSPQPWEAGPSGAQNQPSAGEPTSPYGQPPTPPQSPAYGEAPSVPSGGGFGQPAPAAADPGQPAAFGAAGQFAQSGYGQPTSGQPSYGQPTYGQGGPPVPPKSNKGLLFGLLALVVVAALGVGGFFLFKGDDSEPTTKRTTTTTNGPEPVEFDAQSSQDTAEQFFEHINDEDYDDAKALLCEAEQDDFQDDVDAGYDARFKNVEHADTEKDGDEYLVSFDVDVVQADDKSDITPMVVIFTVVDEDGPKLCHVSFEPIEVDDPQEFTAASAEKIVRQYFEDINANDKVHAVTLICRAQKTNFQTNIEKPTSDFTNEFTKVTVVSNVKDGSQFKVTVDLEGHKRSSPTATFTDTLVFGVVDEDGPKICSEASA